jgi:hypothetical protein
VCLLLDDASEIDEPRAFGKRDVDEIQYRRRFCQRLQSVRRGKPRRDLVDAGLDVFGAFSQPRRNAERECGFDDPGFLQNLADALSAGALGDSHFYDLAFVARSPDADRPQIDEPGPRGDGHERDEDEERGDEATPSRQAHRVESM